MSRFPTRALLGALLVVGAGFASVRASSMAAATPQTAAQAQSNQTQEKAPPLTVAKAPQGTQTKTPPTQTKTPPPAPTKTPPTQTKTPPTQTKTPPTQTKTPPTTPTKAPATTQTKTPATTPTKTPATTQTKAAADTKAASGQAKVPPPPAKASSPQTKTTPSPAKPGAAKTAEKPIVPADTASVTIMREVFDYASGGRRDPFLSLLTTAELRPTLSDLQLNFILYNAQGASTANIRDNYNKKPVTARVGTTFGRMRVVAINPKAVVFSIDDFGTTRRDSLVVGITIPK